jgi:hypothetical protein
MTKKCEHCDHPSSLKESGCFDPKKKDLEGKHSSGDHPLPPGKYQPGTIEEMYRKNPTFILRLHVMSVKKGPPVITKRRTNPERLHMGSTEKPCRFSTEMLSIN